MRRLALAALLSWPVAAAAQTPPLVLCSCTAINIAGWTTTANDCSAPLSTTDGTLSALDAPLANPLNLFEQDFELDGGRYHVWLRLSAAGNSKLNDAVWVQFSAAVNDAGAPVHRIGTTAGLNVNLATSAEAASLNGWGWQNGAYWLAQVNPVTLPPGVQRLRVQYREDGVSVDQIYLSKDPQPPGGVTNDPSRYQCTAASVGLPPLVIPPPVPPPPDPPAANTVLSRLRVATWDVNRALDAKGASAFEAQVEQLASTGAQVIALQHVLRGTADMVAGYESGLEARTGRQWTGVFRPANEGGSASAEQGVLLLTWLPLDNIASTKLIQEPAAPERQGVAVRVQVTINSQPVNIIATQLDGTDAANRDVQLQTLKSWVDAFSSRRVVVGAFGAEPDDVIWSSWRAAYRDVWRDLVFTKTADEGSTTEVAAPTGAPGRPDYQWQALVTPTETGVFKSTLSTHHLIFVDYKVQ
jgi:endonuclease/exonuclease/phosphatase family metal-dependent hydrolase